MLDKIVKIKFFDGMTYRSYEVGQDDVIDIEVSNMVKITKKNHNGKRHTFIKTEYMELFTKNT